MARSKHVEDIPVHQLRFDKKNPRLPERLHGASKEVILEWMISQGDVLPLMASIASTGYTDADPILIVKINSETNSDENVYEVIEGNRRLSAVILLHNPGLAKTRPKAIKSIVESATHELPSEIPSFIYDDRDEILAYLGYRHITGIKSWGPHAKARYLKRLYHEYEGQYKNEDELFAALASALATKPYYAKKMLAALTIYKHVIEQGFWGNENLTETSISFSVLSTALSYTEISKYVGLKSPQDWRAKKLDDKHVKDLIEWCFEIPRQGMHSRVPESRELGRLALVVANEEALKAFKGGSTLIDSALYTSEADENFAEFIRKSLEWANAAQRQLFRMGTVPAEPVRVVVRELTELSKSLELVIEKKQNTVLNK